MQTAANFSAKSTKYSGKNIFVSVKFLKGRDNSIVYCEQKKRQTFNFLMKEDHRNNATF